MSQTIRHLLSRRLITAADVAMIDVFIAEHGVTMCPPAYCAPTQAQPDVATLALHEARGLDPMGKSYKAGWAGYWAKRRREKP